MLNHSKMLAYHSPSKWVELPRWTQVAWMVEAFEKHGYYFTSAVDIIKSDIDTNSPKNQERGGPI